MNLIKREKELWLYHGAREVFAYRDDLALGQFRFGYAYVLPERDRETIYATFYALLEGEPSTLNISVEKKPDGGWTREHAIEPGVPGGSIYSGT